MIKLSSIVEEYMREEERLDSAYYDLYLDYASTGLRDMSYDVSGVVRQDIVAVNTDNNTADLPTDLVKLVGISAFDSSGKLIALSRNNDLFKGLDDCGNAVGTSSGAVDSSYSFGFPSGARHFRDGSITGAFYGLGGTSVFGEYRYNKEYNRIELSTYSSLSNLVIEYISNVRKVNGSFLVHEYLIEPLKNWIELVSKRRKRNISKNEINYLEDVYNRSKYVAKLRFSSISFKEMKDLSRRSFMQSPKF